VIQVAGIFFILFGIFGKLGALFVTIPDPVVGGVLMVMFGKPLFFVMWSHFITYWLNNSL